MAKSIKLNNETYIDSSGIIHKKQTLETILDELEELKPTILYDNSNGTTENITLNESINNFSAFCVFFTKNGRNYSTGKLVRTSDQENLVALNYSESEYGSDGYFIKISNEEVSINNKNVTRFDVYFAKIQLWSSSITSDAVSDRSSIIRIEGYR